MDYFAHKTSTAKFSRENPVADDGQDVQASPPNGDAVGFSGCEVTLGGVAQAPVTSVMTVHQPVPPGDAC